MIIPNDIDFGKYLQDISYLEAPELKWGDHWYGELTNLVENGHEVTGHKLPWGKTHNHFRLRPGELTIWAGINGHRKSMFVGQIMLWLAKFCRVCIASLEMKPVETLYRMCCQAAGCKPSKPFSEAFAMWTNERVCIYDQLDTIEWIKILGVVHYASKELDCKHIVIDSLMKCGLREEDYDSEKKFVDRLQWAAKRYNVHIHLICHMRKGMSEDRIPNKFDVKGTGGITDIADNVVVIWKDKRKEEAKKKQKFGLPMDSTDLDSLDKPDQKMIIEKQRHGDWEGSFQFWFDDSSLQFVPNPDKGAMPFSLATQEAAA